ncbi:ammonia-forming cytochrome c nitrite reductase subunit c552 [Seleniivibrio sp.]|uniref:ammonia-forming cytochrome c nitrite reductase subunit c552 n=1 Tax=Seleniivibrio sp. TaxID=2898801 RepID=UPI0025D3BD7C|nr:ammonia-forming cytochrome c nitrite reductase subunit c552 [Seleniivibrio sp.]MCD8554995.1 ammonia-forming cytochrome c nitrite reductase subunit c552 [Seleniivibrio sp.]
MRFVKFLLAVMSLFALTACMGGGDVKSSINDDTRIIVTTQVGSNGELNYVGSGDMEGFSVSADSAELAGKTVTIEKAEASYSVDGYISLSSLYKITVSGLSTTVPAKITLPYNANILASEGGSAADSVFCSLGSSVTELTTAHGAGSDVSATVSLVGNYFAGYKSQITDSTVSGIIKLSAVSYSAATSTLTDPSGKSLPDTSRGIDHVQVGEKIFADVDEIVFGETVTSYLWTLTSKPTGSSATLTYIGTAVSMVPDVAGTYKLTLTLNGVNGKTLTETKSVFALTYSDDPDAGTAMCYVQCHTGIFASSDIVDKYGRELLRNLTTPWGTSAHGQAFADIAGETDSTCYQCHATGFRYDGRTADGYDEKVTNWTPMESTGAGHLEGVTCEACHGPNSGVSGNFFDRHYDKTPTTSNVCLTCHDYSGVSGHSFKYSDTHDKSHTLANGNVARNASCFKCHTGEGMMGRIFNTDINPSNTESVSGIGCSVCHDPHGESGLASQLRTTGSYTIPSGTIASAGTSKLCYYCHNADVSLPAVGTIPHNTQAEFMQGVGGYEYGQNLGFTKSIHGSVDVQCATCHMKENGKATHELDMHDNPAGRITTCVASGCHTTSPTYTDGHFEYDGRVANVRDKMDQLKAAINTKAGEPVGSAVKASYSASTAALSTALNRAAYNYNYLLYDRSGGFHNPEYAESLLDLSIADLAAN